MIRAAWQRFDRWSTTPFAELEPGPARTVSQVLQTSEDAVKWLTWKPVSWAAWRAALAYVRALRRDNNYMAERIGREVTAVVAENVRLRALNDHFWVAMTEEQRVQFRMAELARARDWRTS